MLSPPAARGSITNAFGRAQAANRLRSPPPTLRNSVGAENSVSGSRSHSPVAIGLWQLATSGLRQTAALIETCSSDSSAA
jgi:hypothetical protein